MAKIVRIGIFGVGHLGKIHLKLLKEIPGYEVIGFYDPDDKNAQKAIDDFGIKRFDSAKKLIET